jgi:hypothetical protein
MKRNHRLVTLLRAHRVRIARAMARQVRSMSPRYQQVELEALERSFYGLNMAIERMFESGEHAELLDRTAFTAQLRAQLGFQLEDLTVAGLCYFPVIRRFLLDHSETVDDALDDLDDFDRIAIPVLARGVGLFRDAGDATVPGSFGGAFQVERVIGPDDDEQTASYSGLFSSRA